MKLSTLQFGLTGVHITITLPQDQPAPKEEIGIDPGLIAVTTMAPAVSREDSHPQAIFKLYHTSSLNTKFALEI